MRLSAGTAAGAGKPDAAALVALQSGHFAKVKDAGKARQRLEYGSFSATFGRCASAEN
jgi:hypothetical protein